MIKLRQGRVLLTWPAVHWTLLVDHLLNSASEQHAWGVMVVRLEGLAGTVGLLGRHAAGSLLSVSRGGSVAAFLFPLSLPVSLSVSLALGERAEGPLLLHLFHAERMLGLPLHSPDILAVGLFRSSLCVLFCLELSRPLLIPLVWMSVCPSVSLFVHSTLLLLYLVK